MKPAQRLLQAVCYPGHGVLVRGREVALSSGDGEVVRALARIARDTPDAVPAGTEALDDAHVVCWCRDATYVLAVAVARGLDTQVVHARIERALALYARGTTTSGWLPPGGSGSGPSGAPAELFLRRPPRRPS